MGLHYSKLIVYPVSMAKLAFAGLVTGAAAGGKLAITWEDCGDADTHGHITDLQPSEIEIGTTGTMTGTGTIDEALTDGTFTIQMTASLGIKETFTGKACEAKTFKLPLGLGTVSWGGLDCPVAAGAITQSIGFTTSSIVPAALAKADISASAMDQDGNKAICVTAHLAREFSTEGDCSGSACEKVCECAFSSCSSQASACLADSACAAKQSCAFGCSCGDTVCIATCAAGDSLAGAVVQCVASSCSGSETTV